MVFRTATHGISNPIIHDMLTLFQMVYRTPYTWYFERPTHGIYNRLTHDILTPSPDPWNIKPRNYGILNPLPMGYLPSLLSMVYRTPYPWHYEPPIHCISKPYPWYFEPLRMSYRTPLSMVFRPAYIWYIEPSTRGISNPLPMVYRTLLPMVF
jgi:hypothetical protein